MRSCRWGVVWGYVGFAFSTLVGWLVDCVRERGMMMEWGEEGLCSADDCDLATRIKVFYRAKAE
jgi:hypothetical protein